MPSVAGLVLSVFWLVVECFAATLRFGKGSTSCHCAPSVADCAFSLFSLLPVLMASLVSYSVGVKPSFFLFNVLFICVLFWVTAKALPTC